MSKSVADVLRVSDAERFRALVDERGADDCWPWLGSRLESGYGQFNISGWPYRAHRVSFMVAFGWEPPAVLHKCDNPPCVNPRHLFGGTQKDNVADCIAKGRFRYQIQPAVRNTIHALRESGCSQRVIARQVGVSPSSVCRVLRSEA